MGRSHIGWVVIDWTVSVGNLLQIVLLIAGGLAGFFKLRSDIRVLEVRQDALAETMKNVSSVLTTVAVQDTRISMLETTINEMRHGQGFVNPMRS